MKFQVPDNIQPKSLAAEMERVKLCQFEILGHHVYFRVHESHEPYIQMYIESIKNGKPDKEGIIELFQKEKHQKVSPLDIALNKNRSAFIGHSSYSITGELNIIETQLKPIIDKLKRINKIDDLLK